MRREVLSVSRSVALPELPEAKMETRKLISPREPRECGAVICATCDE